MLYNSDSELKGDIMARTGGNPELQKFKFKPAGSEPNNQHLQLMIPESMNLKLKSVEGWQDFVRGAIARALADE